MSIIQFNPKATLDLVTRSQWRAVDLDIWSPMGKGGRKGLNLIYGIDKRDQVTDRALLVEKDFLRRLQVLFATLKGRHPQFVDEHKLHTLHDVQWNLCELQKYLCPQQPRAYVPQAQPAPPPAKRRRVVPRLVATNSTPWPPAEWPKLMDSFRGCPAARQMKFQLEYFSAKKLKTLLDSLPVEAGPSHINHAF